MTTNQTITEAAVEYWQILTDTIRNGDLGGAYVATTQIPKEAIPHVLRVGANLLIAAEDNLNAPQDDEHHPNEVEAHEG